jgi:hypothetical protein
MARIVYSGLIQEIGGSVGGSTFQRNAFGHTIRRKALSTKGFSSRQQESRLWMSQVIAAWNALSAADKAIWDRAVSFYFQFAKRNGASLLTGRALFLKYNLVRLQAGLSLLTTFSYLSPIFHNYTFSVFNVVSAYNCISTGQQLETLNHWMLASFSAPLVIASPSKLCNVKVCKLSVFELYYYKFETDYVARYGRLLAGGDYVDVRVKVFATDMPVIFQTQTFRSIIQSA